MIEQSAIDAALAQFLHLQLRPRRAAASGSKRRWPAVRAGLLRSTVCSQRIFELFNLSTAASNRKIHIHIIPKTIKNDIKQRIHVSNGILGRVSRLSRERRCCDLLFIIIIIYMLRALTTVRLTSLARPLFYFFSQQKGSLVPSALDHGRDFYSNIYGICLQKHLFPFGSYNLGWKASQLTEYRKRMPNYVVVLVNRPEGETDGDLKNRFYNISTYCRIKYHPNYTELIGLYRVRVNKVEAVKDEAEPKGQVPVQDNQTQQGLEEVEEEDAVEAVDESPIRPIKLDMFSLQVNRIDDPPLVLNHHLEIKLKFLVETYKKFFPAYNRFKFLLFNPSQASKNIYLMAQQLSNDNFKPKEVQAILELSDHQQKMDDIQGMMDRTFDWKQVYREFEKVAQSNLKNKKFYEYYSEILKIAKQRIDGKKGKELFLEKVTKDFARMKPPKQIKEVFEQQKQKYMQMQETAVESGVVKKYLQDLSKIPYSIKSQELFDLEAAEKALQQEHYGMKEVKDAILQIMAVGKLKGTLRGKIFCLIGGPGLGKTTIAKSIAKALGRKFYNISLGGVTDSSVLKGHRRTYVAAYAGKIIQALKSCETNNPVILLDQIDKMGSGSQGDPRSELLEILDPNQNNSFVDNYIDLPVDLSNVLFICSANYERNISKPLLDRMERIYLNSYTDDQKQHIFQKHLLRRAINRTGVKQEQFSLDSEVVKALIQDYSRGQPGVRRLQKNIQKILERVAYKIVEQNEALPININNSNLRDYLGNSYRNPKDHHSIGVGLAISLGGGDYGSRLTYIQSFKKSFANKRQIKRGVMFTGSLGDVFKEAMNISYTYARNFLLTQLNNRFLYQNQVHIHAPDGASKKDGSTDSLTIASSLVSLALQTEVRKGIAMTGELTLHGKILRTSGIKEKVLLARRQQIWDLIIPVENQPDISMLAANIREGINFHFVSEFSQVYYILFPQLSTPFLQGRLDQPTPSISRVQSVI